MRLRPLALAASLLIASPALAAPVIFTPMAESGPEVKLVRSFLGDDVKAQTALVDLDGDAKPEVFVQLGDDCDKNACRVIVYRELQSDWAPVLDRVASSIATGGIGMGRVRDLEFDGVRWEWDSPRYWINVAQSGTAIELDTVPAEYREPLAQMFGPGASVLLANRNEATLEYAEVRTSTDGPAQILVRLRDGGACGRVYGCPFRLLQVVDGAYQPILEGFANGDIVLSEVKRDGRPDIITALPGHGYAVYGWTGSAYGQIELVKGY